jgi:hypothetical protein
MNKNLVFILILLSCINFMRADVLSINSFGSNEVIINGGEDKIEGFFFSSKEVIKGEESAGGSTLVPGEKLKKDLDNYNLNIVCGFLKTFLEKNSNYTYQEKESLKNLIAIELGFAISDELLNELTSNFNFYCEGYNETYVPPKEEEKKSDYLYLLIIFFILLTILLILYISSGKDRKNWEVIKKLNELIFGEDDLCIKSE